MTRQRRSRARKSRMIKWWITIWMLILAAGLAAFLILPNPLHEQPDWKGLKKPIFVEGVLMDEPAHGTGESLQLPLSVVQEQINANIHYEQDTRSVILTTGNNIMQLQEGSKTANLNMKSVQLRVAPEQVGDIVYIPVAPLKHIYHIDFYEDPQTGAVILMRAGDRIQYAHTTAENDQAVPMRAAASIHSRIYADVTADQRLRIWETGEQWVLAQLDNGVAGYIQRQHISLNDLVTVPVPKIPDNRKETDWRGKKVNLAWEAVYDSRINPHSIGELPGVNVLSPTWFEIIDSKGNVRSKADMEYVNWAHNRNKEVWALLSNGFDADRTTVALGTYENRSRIIAQMLEYASMYQLDGINIDFESVHTSDGPNVVQFIRELKPLATQSDLVLSMDVTPKSNSELWSKFLDRRALAPSLDYMMLMAYDEHWASSPQAGSVASLPWVENAVQRVLQEDEVPADKLILGVPLYTRVWTEQQTNGKTKVSSRALGMQRVANLIKEKGLQPVYDQTTGQNYVEYKENGATQKIWLEDEVSLQARVQLASKLGLAGIASWTRGLGDDRAWNVLDNIKK
ncbi:glycosyl hydrolase family 18 protein [Paenibacillus hunanensis]|uniref:glycosyl hydrolase family 18 protein n=1 Tax=Paenibacillus hunanensis TaxID=539262 RepID=UPI002A6AA5C2|nr:glycosyl hydrolase family 18 protein [Paenibacillus hunanensis]WPP40732.1 glycosyl hydrolase family 18 protein [Paenibacillus hunanensis]